MSGTSSTEDCPICGKEMSVYTDWKPHDIASGECLHCGFCYYTKSEQMSLVEINDLRKDYNENHNLQKPLKLMTAKERTKWSKKIKKQL